MFHFTDRELSGKTWKLNDEKLDSTGPTADSTHFPENEDRELSGKSWRDAEKLRSAKREATYFRQSISTLMDLHGIDLWIAPSAPGPAPKGLESTGDPVMNLPWTQAGLPVLGLPTGKASNGLPLGTQLIADFNQDEELLSWGAEIEQVLKSAL